MIESLELLKAKRTIEIDKKLSIVDQANSDNVHRYNIEKTIEKFIKKTSSKWFRWEVLRAAKQVIKSTDSKDALNSLGMRCALDIHFYDTYLTVNIEVNNNDILWFFNTSGEFIKYNKWEKTEIRDRCFKILEDTLIDMGFNDAINHITHDWNNLNELSGSFIIMF